MRTEELVKIAKRRQLDMLLVRDQANVRALTGINCDNAVLEVKRLSGCAVKRLSGSSTLTAEPLNRLTSSSPSIYSSSAALTLGFSDGFL